MNLRPFVRRACRSPVSRFAIITLAILAWSTLAFCGEIHRAVADGDLAKVKLLLRGDPNLISSQDDDGSTPLHWAARNGSKDVAELLLASKADVNAKNEAGNTPLHEAAANGYKKVVELLLTNKADVNAKDKAGDTPLDLAVFLRSTVVAELLRTNGAEVNIYNASAVGDLQKVKALLKNTPNLVSSKDIRGMTPLHWAAWNGRSEVGKYLLANKADVNAKDEASSTPMELAAILGSKEMVGTSANQQCRCQCQGK